MTGNWIIEWVKRHPIITYIVLAYGLTWACKAPLVAHVQGYISWAPSPYLHYLGGFGPLVAALVVTFLIAGWRGIDDIVARMFRWKGCLKWVIFAALLTPALFVVSLLLIGGSGSFSDPGKFFGQAEIPGLPFYVLWILFIVCNGFGEETGWRGFLLPRLQDKHGALTSAVLVTLVWAPWHLMDFFQRDTFMHLGFIGTFGWFMALFCGSVVFTWIYNESGGSILAVALAHGTLDICTSIPNADQATYLLSMLFIVIAIAAIIIGRPKNLARRERQQSHASETGK